MVVECVYRIVRELEVSVKRRFDWVGICVCFVFVFIVFFVVCENRESVNSLVFEVFSEFLRRKNSYILWRGVKFNIILLKI